MGTIVQVKHFIRIWVASTKLAPTLGDDDSHSRLRACLLDDMRCLLRIIENNTAKPHIKGLCSLC